MLQNPGPSAACMADAALGEPVFDAGPDIAEVPAPVMEPIPDANWDESEEAIEERAEDALDPVVTLPTASLTVRGTLRSMTRLN